MGTWQLVHNYNGCSILLLPFAIVTAIFQQIKAMGSWHEVANGNHMISCLTTVCDLSAT